MVFRAIALISLIGLVGCHPTKYEGNFEVLVDQLQLQSGSKQKTLQAGTYSAVVSTEQSEDGSFNARLEIKDFAIKTKMKLNFTKEEQNGVETFVLESPQMVGGLNVEGQIVREYIGQQNVSYEEPCDSHTGHELLGGDHRWKTVTFLKKSFREDLVLLFRKGIMPAADFNSSTRTYEYEYVSESLCGYRNIL